ncbi:MAG: hypothetical protein K6G43_01910 [Lachnospiraceae bacterium]|nr:hypothetical protein [Lachnospiraceae bacterium]
MKARISAYKAELNSVKKEYEESEAFLKNNSDIEIPPRFRHEGALNNIIKGLRAREFVSLEQAFFRYEESMNRG